ncbi:MAG: adenylate/guanylate cyclase domain-containing protein [Fimbriimonadaceae bacterium]|nr:adenylate/guanylate cyclase domain-containing protein [Fimbriimonadaceae bacterium]
MQGIPELIRHLGSNPEDRDAAELARRFGLDQGVVELAIERAPLPDKPPPKEAPPKVAAPNLMERFWRFCTERPGLLLAIATVVSWVYYVLLGLVRTNVSTHSITVAVFSPIFLQFSLYGAMVYQLRSWKWTLLCALLLPVGLGASVAVLTPSVQSLFVAASLIVTFSVIATVVYVPLATFSSYQQVRAVERAKRARTRQELIVRLLDIRERLESSGSAILERPANPLDWVRARQWIVLPVAALVLRLVGTWTLVTVDPDRSLITAQQNPGTALSPAMLLASVVAMLVQVAYSAFVFFAGYVSRSLKLAVAFALVFEVLGYVLLFGPLRYMDPVRFLGSNLTGLGLSVALSCVIAIAGAMASKFRDHLQNARLERENDAATLTAEMIEIEWLLRPQTRHVFAMVVDVVGSTGMKSKADPLVAEATFREYQNLLSRMAEGHGGKVHATAGDGTVLGFDECDQAMEFAAALHHALPSFNSLTNRLPDEFRIRIGIHRGEVTGDLGEVSFTSVIDVAAHIEASAPVGGTAVSGEVASLLPKEASRPLGRSVEGHEIYITGLTGPSETITPAEASK